MLPEMQKMRIYYYFTKEPFKQLAVIKAYNILFADAQFKKQTGLKAEHVIVTINVPPKEWEF